MILGPVWYNLNNVNNDPPVLKRGVVDSVSLDFATRDMTYNVIYIDEDSNKSKNVIVDSC